MYERRQILDLFDQQREFVDKRTNEGIEKYRKGDASIRITDEKGEPLSHAVVKVKQTSHEFRFGTNIFMLDQLETDEKNQTYKQYIADTFNMATLPFYWDTLEPERGKPRYDKDSPYVYRRPAIDTCIDFCESHGIEPREHALAYDAFFPKWLYGASVSEVKRELERRYAEIAARYADKIPTIEVTNEMQWIKGKTAFYEEPEFVEWCFKLAEKYFPDNQLVINEITNLSWEDRGRATDKYYAYIEANLLKGARIDAIGMQYHLFNKKEEEYERTRLTLNPQNLYRHMDLYTNLGKPLQITEVTIPAYSWEESDEQLQAEILKNLYTLWFSHRNVEQIVYWNLVDGYAHLWDTDPAKIRASQGDMTRGENYYYGGLLRFDLTPKPALRTLQDLIHKVWHTEEIVVTNADGACAFRGFYGDYLLEIEANGKRLTKAFSLSSKQDNTIAITIEK